MYEMYSYGKNPPKLFLDKLRGSSSTASFRHELLARVQNDIILRALRNFTFTGNSQNVLNKKSLLKKTETIFI